MYPITTRLKKDSYLCLILLIFSFLPQQVEAKRFNIPSDSDVLLKINKGERIPVLPRDNFKVLVWNMYKAGKESWDKDYPNLIRGKDILLLQEFFTTPRMLDVIKRDIDRDYFLSTSFLDKKHNMARTGVATASQYEMVNVGWQRSYYREPIINTPKMTGIAVFDLEGTDKDLMTLNIHAVNFVSTRKLEHMVQEGIKAANKHNGPVIFAGDFNTWSSKKQSMLFKLMQDNGFKNVQFTPDTRMKTFGKVLDFVFVRDLRVNYSKVYGNIEGSDHKAMEVHLSY